MSNLADLERPRRIEPRLHEAVEDRPWYDTELDLAQSPAHSAMVIDLASVLGSLASELSLTVLSDASVWFINPGTDEQQVSFPDLAVLRPGTEVRRATAEEALFIGEVVSTQDRRKEIKDTRFQAAFSEYNDVPEFALFFPELDDARALTWFRMVDGLYEEVAVAPGAEVASTAIPGLAFRVLPREAWRPGRKVDVVYRGELRLPVEGERARAEEERARAEEERARAEEERARAEKERARAERLESQLDAAKAREDELKARLRAAGLDPDAP